MRRLVLSGASLVVAIGVVFWFSDLSDLQVEPVVLLGVAVGAVLALVQDGTALARATGFAAGFVSAWALYAVRAQYLPDSTGGKFVFAAGAVALCVVVAAVSLDRIPLWSALLGAGAMAGAFETAYAAAPPETLTTSTTAATSMLLVVAAGFAATAAFEPIAGQHRRTGHVWLPRQRAAEPETSTASIDELMEHPQ